MSNIRMNNPGSSRDQNCPPSEKRQRLNNGRSVIPSEPMGHVVRIPFLEMPVNRQQVRIAGSYIIGPEVHRLRPAQSLLQFIARKQNTNQFFLLKIVQQSTRPNRDPEAIYDEQRARLMLRKEYSLLSLLQDDPGVIKQHGIFSDDVYEDMTIASRQCMYTGVVVKRHILVLDCLERHPFCDKSTSNCTLFEYLQARYFLFEGEALYIFHAIIQTMENVHKKNIVHRDLRAENITLNRVSKTVKIINFWLGRFSSDKNLVLYDQCGSPNFISPEIVAGKPYKGKPADMWALGIILFTMLYGRLPFYKPTKREHFGMIAKGEYQIPEDKAICSHTVEIIKGLLKVDPEARLTVTQVRVKLESILAMKRVKTVDQCVPEEESTPKPAENSESADSSDYDQVVPVFIPKDKQKSDAPFVLKHDDFHCISNYATVMTNQLRRLKLNADIPIILTRNIVQPTVFKTHNLRPGVALRLVKTQGSSNIEVVIDDVIPPNKVREFIKTTETYLISRPIPRPLERNKRFTGILTHSVAVDFCHWITTEFQDFDLVQQSLLTPNHNVLARVEHFLVRCGFQLEKDNDQKKIAKKQNSTVLANFLRHMLQATGYTGRPP